MFGIARLNTNGRLDTTFNTTGLQTVTVQPAARRRMTTSTAVVVQPTTARSWSWAGESPESVEHDFGSPSDIAVARLNSNGTLDTTFNSTGMLTFNYNLGGQPAPTPATPWPSRAPRS